MKEIATVDETWLVKDDFRDERKAGRALGTRSPCGALRQGRDVESCMAIDHGAFRFRPLLRDGWGRQCLSYGPLAPEPGFACAVGLLNGHHASQAGDLGQGFGVRLKTWLRAGGIQSGRQRLWGWLVAGQHRTTLRQFLSWALRSPRLYERPCLDENLAVGLFPGPDGGPPDAAPTGFVVHSQGPENGELWVRVAGRHLPVASYLPNVPLLLVMLQRGESTIYAVASSESVRGVTQVPYMRPVAVARSSTRGPVHLGIQQSCLGQIGFRADTRVYGVRAAQRDRDEEWGAWVTDPLSGRGRLSGAAGAWGTWRSGAESFERTIDGCRGHRKGALCWAEGKEAAGLVHVSLDTSSGSPPAVLFGGRASESFFGVVVSERSVALWEHTAGTWKLISSWEEEEGSAVRQLKALQLLGDGEGTWVILDGRRLFGAPVPVAELTRVGFLALSDARGTARDLEVWPRKVRIPPELCVPLPSLVSVGAPRLVDVFDDAREAKDLAGRELAPEVKWQKDLGEARIVVDAAAGGAIVRDAAGLSGRGRTVYTVPWDDPGLAELEIQVRPPGDRRGQGEEGRAGVVFWQDADNYVLVGTWLHDHYEGASISSFYRLRGFEDLYDAVWTNVGRRIRWGSSYHLKVRFDGARFTAWLDDEAVLYRAVSDIHPGIDRLRIRRVGLVANWEWGADTGSVFQRFSARGSASIAQSSGQSRPASGRIQARSLR